MHRPTQEPPVPRRLKWIGLSFESVASHSAKYRPDIDGLRAIAVLAVVFYHSGFSKLRGGFVGVDIFYVISGYLITSILAKDLAQDKFSIISFYERRMRRIFPALFTVLFFCIAVALVLLDPHELVGFAKELTAATFFFSNIYFWHNSHSLGYFDTAVSSQPLLHTWSLSVEEQFYLLFPLTLFLLFRWAPRRMGLWLLAAAILSFALNLWTTGRLPIIAFYWFPPRAWELLIGAVLALKSLPALPSRAARETGGFLGAALIAAAVFLPIEHLPFPGVVALLPCVGTWLVIYAGESGPSITRTALSFRPLVFIGTLSYSLYLWHWPIIVFCAHQPFHPMQRLELLISFVLAFVSFEYIERPFRGAQSTVSRRQIFVFGGIVSVLTSAFALAAGTTNGLLLRYAPRSRSIVVTNLARMDDYDTSCGNWKTDVHSLTDIKFCVLGDKLPHKILFWGDSHVEQLYPELQQLYAARQLENHGAVFAIANSCLPDGMLNRALDGFHCDAFSRLVLSRAALEDIDTVFIGFSTWWGRHDFDYCAVAAGRCSSLRQDALRRAFFTDLAGEIRTLRREGKRVIVSLPFPIYDREIPELEISNAMFGRFGISQSAKNIAVPALRDETRMTALEAGADIFDPAPSLCHQQQCTSAINGVSLYKDDNHLAKSSVGLLADALRVTLQRDAGASKDRVSLPQAEREIAF